MNQPASATVPSTGDCTQELVAQLFAALEFTSERLRDHAFITASVFTEQQA